MEHRINQLILNCARLNATFPLSYINKREDIPGGFRAPSCPGGPLPLKSHLAQNDATFVPHLDPSQMSENPNVYQVYLQSVGKSSSTWSKKGKVSSLELTAKVQRLDCPSGEFVTWEGGSAQSRGNPTTEPSFHMGPQRGVANKGLPQGINRRKLLGSFSAAPVSVRPGQRPGWTERHSNRRHPARELEPLSG